MTYHSRKPTRIPGYDYASENYYFITICTHNKKCIFGTADRLNELGEIAKEGINNIPTHFENVRIDNAIVMPNHVHLIVAMGGNDTEKRVDLNNVIGLYKSGVSRKIRRNVPDLDVWQRSFHDHIIRDQREYEKIWQYVQFNWQKWEQDCFYPNTEQA